MDSGKEASTADHSLVLLDSSVLPEITPVKEIESFKLEEGVADLLQNGTGLSTMLLKEHVEKFDHSYVLSPVAMSIYISMLNDVCASDLPDDTSWQGGLERYLEQNAGDFSSFINDVRARDLSANLSFVNIALINNNQEAERQDAAFLPTIKSKLERDYYSLAASGDFLSDSFVSAVSNWAKEHSNGRISVVPDIKMLDIYLSSSMYFSCDWSNGFDQNYTSDKEFHSPMGATRLPMMYGDIQNVGYYKGNTFTSIQLPLGKGGKFAMNIMLPDGESTKERLKEMFEISGLEYENEALMHVSIPRISSSGVVGESALLKLTGEKDVLLSQNVSVPTVIRIGNGILTQYGKFAVDEKGVLGKSYTFTPGAGDGDAPDAATVKSFTADHPFVFKVVERTKNIELFSGYYTGESL